MAPTRRRTRIPSPPAITRARSQARDRRNGTAAAMQTAANGAAGGCARIRARATVAPPTANPRQSSSSSAAAGDGTIISRGDRQPRRIRTLDPEGSTNAARTCARSTCVLSPSERDWSSTRISPEARAGHERHKRSEVRSSAVQTKKEECTPASRHASAPTNESADATSSQLRRLASSPGPTYTRTTGTLALRPVDATPGSCANAGGDRATYSGSMAGPSSARNAERRLRRVLTRGRRPSRTLRPVTPGGSRAAPFDRTPGRPHPGGRCRPSRASRDHVRGVKWTSKSIRSGPGHCGHAGSAEASGSTRSPAG